MTDVFSTSKRSEVMSRIRGTDTGPELQVRSIVHRLGYRFRLHLSPKDKQLGINDREPARHKPPSGVKEPIPVSRQRRRKRTDGRRPPRPLVSRRRGRRGGVVGREANSNSSGRDSCRQFVEVPSLGEQLREGDDIRHCAVCLAGVDPVVGDEILKLPVRHPM